MANVISKRNPRMPVAREILTNIEFDEGAYKTFAVIPDNLLDGILETRGWCELELSDDGKTVVNFIATEIPEYIRKRKEEPTLEERIAALAEENATLKEEKAMQEAQISALCDQMDFYEDCIVEMAEVIYA